jgi:hypothetical protein
MFAAQNLRRQGAMDRANIDIQDNEQKMGMLKSLPGMELQALDPQFKNRDFNNQTSQYNIGNALSEIDKKRGADMEAYLEQLRQWGAQKTGDAQSAAASKGGKK